MDEVVVTVEAYDPLAATALATPELVATVLADKLVMVDDEDALLTSTKRVVPLLVVTDPALNPLEATTLLTPELTATYRSSPAPLDEDDTLLDAT